MAKEREVISIKVKAKESFTLTLSGGMPYDFEEGKEYESEFVDGMYWVINGRDKVPFDKAMFEESFY